MRYVLLLQLVLIGLLAAPFAWAQETSPALHVFCQDLLKSPNRKEELKSEDRDWKTLGEALRNSADPTLFVDSEIAPTQEQTECFKLYAPLFKKAEVILKGLELTSLVETLVGSGEEEERFTVDSPRARSAPYESAWENFLTDLRATLSRPLRAQNR
jgi:hypothetical protein